MTALLGSATILVALIAAAAIVVQGIRNVGSGRVSALKWPVTVFVSAAFATFVILEIAILTHDFSIGYVANNTATTTPLIFLFASGWAALEGSIVLWGVMLGLFTWLVWRKVDDGDRLGVGALAVMGAVSVFWFGLMATAGNPFAVCVEAFTNGCAATEWWTSNAVSALQGRGPNPLLQNHILMAVHPPMLYTGYVGFTVPFAYAISALWTRSVGPRWLERTHRWSVVSWSFLTVGIVLGGWWSYEVLGWGGYWAWDPVENAAFLPWLVATAFIHSAVVERRRGMLRSWNFVLVITTFAATILGTFLTRSGVIASVHAFTQSKIGPILLTFLALVVIGSFALFAARAPSIAQAPRLESLLSRDGFILLNNLLLTVFAFAVVVGTMFPLIVEALSGDELSVGRSFFDRVAVPLSLLLLGTIGVGAVAPWRRAAPAVLWNRLRYAVMLGLLAGASTVVAGVDSIGVTVTVTLAVFVIAAIVIRLIDVAMARPESFVAAAGLVIRNEPGYWGGQIAHIGVALVAISLATTSGLAVRDTIDLARGQQARVGDHCFVYVEPFERTDPQRQVTGVRIAVLDEACVYVQRVLEPRLNLYAGTTQPIGTPTVWTTLREDVYLGIAGGSADTVRLNVFIFPLQWLLWFGGAVVVAGGFVALRRKPRGALDPSDEDASDDEDAPAEEVDV